MTYDDDKKLYEMGKALERAEARARELQVQLDECRRELHCGDPDLELIHANRDAMLDVAEKALMLIRRELAKVTGDETQRLHSIADICDAARSFHPMHGESWSGFPKGG